jgi:ATP dependent DNA ligase domain
MSRVENRSISKPPETGSRSGRTDKASPLPRWIPRRLCQLVETAPSGPQWLHEIKLDGFRMFARIERGRAQLLTRTGLDWSGKYPSVVEALAKVGAKTAYLDGELCGMGDDGLPSFSQTQAASDGPRGFGSSISLSISCISTAATSRVCRSSSARRFLSRWSRQSQPSVQRPRDRRRRADPKARRPTWA